MKIIFNEKEVGSFGDLKDPENTPTKLIERKRESLKFIGKFIGADSIEYVDNDKSEDYLITKKGKILKLSIHGNHFDGGWMNVEVNYHAHKGRGLFLSP